MLTTNRYNHRRHARAGLGRPDRLRMLTRLGTLIECVEGSPEVSDQLTVRLPPPPDPMASIEPRSPPSPPSPPSTWSGWAPTVAGPFDGAQEIVVTGVPLSTTPSANAPTWCRARGSPRPGPALPHIPRADRARFSTSLTRPCWHAPSADHHTSDYVTAKRHNDMEIE